MLNGKSKMKTKSFAWRKSILCHGNFIDTSHLYMLQVHNTFCHLFSKQLIPGKGGQRWSEGWRVCDSAPPQVREWEGERKRKEVAERSVDLDLTSPPNTTIKVRDNVSGVSVDKSGCLGRMLIACRVWICHLMTWTMKHIRGGVKKKNWEKAVRLTAWVDPPTPPSSKRSGCCDFFKISWHILTYFTIL